jgi:Ca2+/Na+ antiporter
MIWPKPQANAEVNLKVYEMLLGLFVLIFIMSVVGIVKYGFNIVFLYILLFSAVVIIWSIAAMREDKKDGGDANG